MIIPNLLLIAGTGTKSGKTSMACRLIEQFRDLNITGIKISPHFHETTTGLVSIMESKGYAIFEETNRHTSKDTSRMLHSGAQKAYFAKVWDDQLQNAFSQIMSYIPPCTPFICESPALRKYIDPGIFIIMTSDTVIKKKNISHLQSLPHVMFKLEELENVDSLPIRFEGGKWFYDEVGGRKSEARSSK